MIGIVFATVLSLGELTSNPSYPCPNRAYAHATIWVYKSGTTELAPIYTDILGTSKANPFLADRCGRWQFFAEDGEYDVLASKPPHREVLDKQIPMLGGLTLREFWRRYRRFGARMR